MVPAFALIQRYKARVGPLVVGLSPLPEFGHTAACVKSMRSQKCATNTFPVTRSEMYLADLENARQGMTSATVKFDSTLPATSANSHSSGSRLLPAVQPSMMLKARKRFQSLM